MINYITKNQEYICGLDQDQLRNSVLQCDAKSLTSLMTFSVQSRKFTFIMIIPIRISKPV